MDDSTQPIAYEAADTVQEFLERDLLSDQVESKVTSLYEDEQYITALRVILSEQQ